MGKRIAAVLALLGLDPSSPEGRERAFSIACALCPKARRLNLPPASPPDAVFVAKEQP